jgi:hypothetical protein
MSHEDTKGAQGRGRLGRTVARLTGGAADERLDALERAVRKLAEAQRDQANALQRSFDALSASVARQATEKMSGEILDAVRALGGRIDRQIEDQLAHGGAAEQQRLAERRLFKRFDEIAASRKPIVVGPWTGEVGFELLYWAPFLSWARERWGLAPERHVIVSRGGVSSWYGMPEAGYADLFSTITPDRFRTGTNQEEHKQRRASSFDREVLEAALDSAAIAQAEQIHPELMYRMFMPFWREEAGLATVDRFTRHRRLEPPSDSALDALPADYVAARFYFSDCFPDTAENRAFARMVVTSIAERAPVVLLNPGLRVDDHADAMAPESSRVFTISAGLAPERNLAVQSAVIGRARAFVGTYGGYSYLAPFHGVPALAFYSVRSFKPHHLHVAQRVFERLGSATVIPIDVAHAPLVQLALGTVTAAS